MSIRSNRRMLAHAAVALALVAGPLAAAELQDLPTLQSRGGVLDLLMVARAAPVPALAITAGGPKPQGWVYDVCLRPASGDACPFDATRNYYGGTRLAVQPGDLLKIHFVNRLPPVVDSQHALDPGESFLAMNPTNLHLHGTLVSPHAPTAVDPTWGDNVFVMTFNPANGTPAVSPHLHATVSMGATDYTFRFPATHPAGMFFAHPHVHGLGANQMSAGLSNVVTVGAVTDYACGNETCSVGGGRFPVRHLFLKDAQVLADGTLQDQGDANFCLPASGVAPAGSLGFGSCPGQDQTSVGGPNYVGGKWFFSINGQVAPTMTVGAAQGEVWRLLNSSPSATYDIDLYDPASNREMVMQVLSIDGVSVAPTRGTSLADLARLAGGKAQVVSCPGLTGSVANARTAEPLCVTRLHMMPSSRAEVWVTYRDRNNLPASPAATSTAVLRTTGFNTGPGGDSWPAVDLARVVFTAPAAGAAPVALPTFIGVQGQAKALLSPSAVSTDLYAANQAVGADPTCHALAPGHRRRIFFNVPASDPNAFGLGYEEVDQKGVPVPGTFLDVAPFDPMRPTVCLPLAAGNTAVKETWELVNIANEDHNFHIHQVKFRVLTMAELAGTNLPNRILGDGVDMDNVPVPHADGNCTTVADWRNGLCTAHPTLVEIPFGIAGDFVYHCHILDHEDGGMMARIRVRANP